MGKNSLLIYCLTALITIIWGTTWLAIKVGLDGVSPLTGAALRFLVAGAVLLYFARRRGASPPSNAKSLRHIGIFGICMFFIPYGLVYWGEQRIPSNLASILFSAMPFWVLLYAHFMVPGERFQWQQAIGMALGFLGVILIFGESDYHASDYFTLGMLAVLASAASSGFASVWVKKYQHEIHHFQTTAYGMLLGAFLLLVASRFEPHRFFIPNAMTIGSIVYLGVFGSAVTFSVYTWLMHHVPVVKLSFITFLSPVVAIVVGWVFLHETLEPKTLAGAALILLGIFAADARAYLGIFSRRRLKHPQQHSSIT